MNCGMEEFKIEAPLTFDICHTEHCKYVDCTVYFIPELTLQSDKTSLPISITYSLKW